VSEVKRTEYIMAVAVRLGYEFRPPHHVYRQIESCLLRGMTVEEAYTDINNRSQML